MASGAQTVALDNATKRARRAPYNIAAQWWRGATLSFGGPANFLFAGTPFPPDAAQTGRYLLRDEVIFGGGGRDAYYAAKKIPARRYAAQIAVTPTTRTEKDEAGKTTLEAQITLDGDGLPRAATLSAGGQSASFVYDLKPVAAPIAPLTAPILEDVELQSPSAYTGNEASALFNRGAAFAGNEDAPRAIAALEAAHAAAPGSSAPPLALFEIELALRDANGARQQLERLAPLGLGAGEIEVRRARLALLVGDRAGALAALQTASEGAPQNLSLQFALAEVKRAQSDFEGARALYRAILGADLSQVSDPAQFDAARRAAETLALSATFEELPALLASVPNGNEAQKLARALLQLRAGQTPESAEFARDDFETALALGFERAARDDDAQKAWQALENRAPDALKNRARAHLMTLAARRGDVSGAINEWRNWSAASPGQAARDAAQNAFFAAFQKAFRTDALQSALANRATATAATEDDLRLFLGYQESFGTSADVLAAIESGAARFPSAPFWLGKRAENLLDVANEQRSTEAGTARREQLYNQALGLLDQAIAAAPDEPFYRAQKALVATQRAAKTGGILDPAVVARNRGLAKRETEAFLAAYPDDPDALVSAALQSLAPQTEAGAREAIRLANVALDSAPGAGDGDRHTLIWAARQALASAYRKLNQSDLAAAQWEILLLGARGAGEQATLASSYFALLDSAAPPVARARAATNGAANGAVAGNGAPDDAAVRAANLLAQLATEKWDFAAARGLLESVAGRMAVSPRAGAISALLAAMPGEGASLANATLSLQRVATTRRALESPTAPPAADANFDRATRDLGAALASLRTFAQSPNRRVAARAAALVAENGGLDGAERLELLQSALEKEPKDAALRFALIGALDGAPSQKEREIAAKILDFDLETRRNLASATRRAGDALLAQRIAEEAFALAARAPEYSGGDLQRIAFTLAKSAFAAGQTSRAVEIYNGLSLAQWNDLDRAAALLALARNYKEAGRDEDAAQTNVKVANLGLSAAEIERATAFADEVE